MRAIRRLVLLVWSVICGFAAQAVVYALAQLVVDREATLAWAIAILLQVATFALVTVGVYRWKVDGPFVRGRRRSRADELSPAAARPARPGGR